MKIYLTDNAELPNDGIYSCKTIDIKEVKTILKEAPVTSAIKHDSITKILSKIIGIEIDTGRKIINLEEEDIMIAITLNEKVSSIYDFKMIERIF